MMKKLILFLMLFGIVLNSMAQDKKISELSTASTTIGDSSLYIIVQSSTTKKQYYVDLQNGIWYGGGVYSTGIGVNALENNGGGYNTAMGYHSALSTTTANDIVAIGYYAMRNCGADPDANIAIGKSALINITSDNNVGIGHEVLQDATSAIGNTAIGFRAGANTTDADYCVYLGYYAGEDNNTSNLLFIDNSDDATPLIWGNFSTDSVIINGDFRVTGYSGGAAAWTNESDSTLKKNIVTIENPLIKIRMLRGVTFEWKDAREPGQRMGFIAQEVRDIVPEVVDCQNETLAMQPSQLTALLVEGIKQQQKQIVSLYVVCGVMFFLLLFFIVKKIE